MRSHLVESDERRIYFARKAVNVYKRFKKKHARATDFVNAGMGVDDTFPPMVRVNCARDWRKWKKLVVLLEDWIKKDGSKKFESGILLHTCIVVLSLMIENEAKNAILSNS